MRGFGGAVRMMSHAVIDAVEGSIVAEARRRALRGQRERLRALAAGLPDVAQRMTVAARGARAWYDEVSDVMNVIAGGGAAVSIPPVKLIRRHEQAVDAWYEARKQRRLARQAVQTAVTLGRRLGVAGMAVYDMDDQDSEGDTMGSGGAAARRGVGRGTAGEGGGGDAAWAGRVERGTRGDMHGETRRRAGDDTRGDGAGGSVRGGVAEANGGVGEHVEGYMSGSVSSTGAHGDAGGGIDGCVDGSVDGRMGRGMNGGPRDDVRGGVKRHRGGNADGGGGWRYAWECEWWCEWRREWREWRCEERCA